MPFTRIERIKKRIILPFAAILLLCLVAGLAGAYWLERQSRNEQTRADIRRVERVYQRLLARDQEELQGLLAHYSRHETLKEAFLARDRQRLMALAKPLFEAARASNQVSHLYFIAPDRRVVLRVHQPAVFGDPAPQFTVNRAAESGKPAAGLELGRFGHLSLRVVWPWHRNGQCIGYLELAKEVAPVARELKAMLGGDLLFLLNKKMLDREQWQQGMRILGRNGDWGELPRCVVAVRTLTEIPGDLCQYLESPQPDLARILFRHEAGGRTYNGGILPLLDAGGRQIGRIVVLFDTTDRSGALLAWFLSLGLVAVFLVTGLYLFFSGYLDRIEERLVEHQEAIGSELAAKDTSLRETQARRAESEREVQRLNQRNRLILEAAGQGILGLDSEGRHQFVNPAAARMLGYREEELLGRESHPVWHHTGTGGESRSRKQCPIHQTLTDGRSHQVAEDLFWRKDGSSFWVEYVSTPIWEEGRLAGAVVAFQDITLRKKALDALEASEARYRAITVAARDAILLMDGHGRIVFWNPAAETIFGYSAEEALGSPLHELLVPEGHRAQAEKGVRAFLASGQGAILGQPMEMVALRQGGEEFPVEISLAGFQRQGQWWAVGIVRDISERVRAAREREALEGQLRHAQKMEAIGTLAGGIAHDFNNILSAIMGYTELAMLDSAAGRPVSGHLEEVRRASRRARDLVVHLLTFSRQGEQAPRPLLITPIIKEDLKLLRASLPPAITIEQQIDPEAGTVMADPAQIHQLFMNLCTNAVQAMDGQQGGVLAVELGETELSQPAMIRDFSLAPGRYLRLTVRDTGCGMDRETREHLFEPFYTTRAPGKGTGLGLAVVHGIVKNSNGAVAVASEAGEGATFQVYLPLCRQEAGEPGDGSPLLAEGVAGGRQERVLLVDDEPQLLAMGQRILEYLGYQVEVCASGDKALALFRGRPSEFALVITDQVMPGMSGMELARELLAIRPELAVVLCTGFSEQVGEEEALAAGLKGYITKPLSINQLAAACRRALEEG